MSGSLISLIFACVAKSSTAKPFSVPFWAKIHLVEPSGLDEIAIGEGAGLKTSFQTISLVLVSITFIRFAAGLAPRLEPASTYLPYGVTFKSWMPPLIGIGLIFSSEAVSMMSTPPLGLALICGNSE